MVEWKYKLCTIKIQIYKWEKKKSIGFCEIANIQLYNTQYWGSLPDVDGDKFCSAYKNNVGGSV